MTCLTLESLAERVERLEQENRGLRNKLETGQIVLVDEAAKQRAVLQAAAQVVSLQMWSEQGPPNAAVTLGEGVKIGEDGQPVLSSRIIGLTLSEGPGKANISLVVGEDKASIRLKDGAGETVITSRGTAARP